MDIEKEIEEFLDKYIVTTDHSYAKLDILLILKLKDQQCKDNIKKILPAKIPYIKQTPENISQALAEGFNECLNQINDNLTKLK